MKCPVCKCAEARLRYELKDRWSVDKGVAYPLYLCPDCGLLFQDSSQIEENIESLYPDSYWWSPSGRWSKLEGRYRDWMVRNDQLRFVLTLFPDPSGVRLLEIGCGTGVFIKQARRFGFEALGIDVSPKAIEAARRQGVESAVCATEEELICRGETFDVVVLLHTLEHLLDPLAYLLEVRKLLRPSGILVVQVPNRGSLQAKILRQRWYGLDCPRHICNFTIDALLFLLDQASFKVRKVRHFSLRDNAASLVSSLAPSLDPTTRRIRKSWKHPAMGTSLGDALSEVLYFKLMMVAQPLAWLEAKFSRGATLTVASILEE